MRGMELGISGTKLQGNENAWESDKEVECTVARLQASIGQESLFSSVTISVQHLRRVHIVCCARSDAPPTMSETTMTNSAAILGSSTWHSVRPRW